MRDQPIDNEASLRFRLATLNVGDTVPVKVIRAGKEQTLEVSLMPPPEKPPRDKSMLDGRHPLSGATVVNMSPAVADELGLIEWRDGVAVLEVQPGSYSGRFLRPGDMITAVNGQPLKTVADLKTRIAAGVSSVSLSREGLASTIQFR